MSPARVAVTGLGQVSALGTEVEHFFERACAGLSGVVRLEGTASAGLADPIGAAVPGFDPRAWMSARAMQMSSRATQLAWAAASLAWEAAGLDRSERPRGGVHIGTAFGGTAAMEEAYRACFTVEGARPKPTVIPIAMANGPASHLATELRLKGPNLTFSTACSSGTHAIGQAFRLLRRGEADVMLAGGTDAPLSPIVMAAWNSMRVLAPAGTDPATACRPFSHHRRGLVIGEGAAFLVLETWEHARSRGVEPLAEVVGYGLNADAGHVTHPDLAGIEACLDLALADAALEPAHIGYVNAHGTGTEASDRAEAEALAHLFGDRAPEVLVSSTKGVHGHAMGASGALEAIATALALGRGQFPPTANLSDLDPELPRLDFVAGVARKIAVELAVSGSFGFGGNNAVLVLRRV